jgi:ribosome-binding factor A
VGRVSELIRTVLVDVVQRQINDPRLEGVTFTQVTVTPDTTRADIYYTILGDEMARQNAQEGLESASGWLRREVGSRVRLRNTPALVFHWDPSLEHGDRIEQLLDELGLGQEDDEETQ